MFEWSILRKRVCFTNREGYNCASLVGSKYCNETNCDTSCNDIREFLRSSYSEYSTNFSFDNTWTWTGKINGEAKSVCCPKLSWEK